MKCIIDAIQNIIKYTAFADFSGYFLDFINFIKTNTKPCSQLNKLRFKIKHWFYMGVIRKIKTLRSLVLFYGFSVVVNLVE